MAIPIIVPGFHVERFVVALVVAFMLGLVNLVIKPILIILTLPITFVTLGLFIFVINFILFWFVVYILKGVTADSLGSLVLAWLLYSLAVTFINGLLQKTSKQY